MSTTALQAFDASAWKQAYSAALFETDKSAINSLIVAAEVQSLYGQENCLERRAITAGRRRLWMLRF